MRSCPKMLTEYALIPDIFDSSCYSVSAVCDVHLQNLKEVVLNEGLVRDLRNGEWRAYVLSDIVHRSTRAKELVKKLIKQNRLRLTRAACDGSPTSNTEWCKEAISSHTIDPITGIIAANSIWEEFREEQIVSSIEKLSSATWWQSRSTSCRPTRTTADYIRHLGKVLQQSNSLMFIDPHIDPSRRDYREFIDLLRAIPSNKPVIEIHRVCYEGSGPGRTIFTKDDLKERFSSLNDSLMDVGMRIHVFVWDDFHDRYLVSDVIGISLPYGFDISGNPKDLTTWTRLGRAEKDDVQREFDPSSCRHKLWFDFAVGDI